MSVGVGNGYYDPYYGGYGYRTGYSRYGYPYGFDPYWGWYDGFYYPGTGFYVYDRYRRPYRWTDTHRRYWTDRRERSLASGFREIGNNWSDFDARRTTTTVRQIERSVDRPARIERRVDRPTRVERREARSERGAVRLERQSAREQRKSEARSERATRTSGRGREHRHEQ
jgi:hypothetical protein